MPTALQTKAKVTVLEGHTLDAQYMRSACHGFSVAIHTPAIIDVTSVMSTQTILDVMLKGTVPKKNMEPIRKR